MIGLNVVNVRLTLCYHYGCNDCQGLLVLTIIRFFPVKHHLYRVLHNFETGRICFPSEVHVRPEISARDLRGSCYRYIVLQILLSYARANSKPWPAKPSWACTCSHEKQATLIQ